MPLLRPLPTMGWEHLLLGRVRADGAQPYKIQKKHLRKEFIKAHFANKR